MKIETESRKVSLIIGVLALTGIVAASMQTLVIPLIGLFPSILSTTPDTASWVLTATLLAAAVATPIAGRLGDIYGKRRMMLASAVPLVLGSAVCAMASSVIPMVIGRGLQGLGMGVVPLGISLLRDIVAAHRLGGAVAFMSASMGVGGALGLPFAAAVDEYLGWRPMFWITAATGAIILVLIWRVVPQMRKSNATDASMHQARSPSALASSHFSSRSQKEPTGDGEACQLSSRSARQP